MTTIIVPPSNQSNPFQMSKTSNPQQLGARRRYSRRRYHKYRPYRRHYRSFRSSAFTARPYRRSYYQKKTNSSATSAVQNSLSSNLVAGLDASTKSMPIQPIISQTHGTGQLSLMTSLLSLKDRTKQPEPVTPSQLKRSSSVSQSGNPQILRQSQQAPMSLQN